MSPPLKGVVVRTLLVIDLVDSTRLIEKLGDARSSEVLARSDRIARDLLVEFNGTEIDKTDGFLILFERPLDASRYAVVFHTALAELSQKVGASISARAGIHLGEVVLRSNEAADVARGAKPVEVDGLAKHMAARTMSLAGARQTLLTRAAFELARRAWVGEHSGDNERLEWLAHGLYLFKGMDEPVEIFEVGRPEFAPLAAPLDQDKARRVVTPVESGTEFRTGKLAAGQVITHYRLIEKLAEGGIGVVYKAEDIRLKRNVALKFLHARSLQDPQIRERFIREAQALALLDHPNICTVYEVDEVGDGPQWQTFIAMQYVGGTSLKEKIRQGPLPIPEALDLAIQIGQGLAQAHANGIIHRDIKPANIVLTEDKVPKIVDFGLAIIGPRPGLEEQLALTTEGKISGTLLYMSPEQLRGRKVDHRTDIWSLGAVLFEIVTGRLPFETTSTDVFIHSLLNESPPAITRLRPDIPIQLERIILRAMAKSPDDRYPNIEEMLSDLRAVAGDSKKATPGQPIVAPTEDLPSIAVLPFRDMSPEHNQGYFCEGIAEEITNAIMQLPGLRVASRSSSFQFVEAYDVREVGRRLNVTSVLEGSVRRALQKLRVTAQLTNTSNGYQLWSQRYDGTAADIFEIQDEISMGIVKNLDSALVGDRRPFKRHTDNVEAHNLYLKGRYYWNHRVPDAIRKSMQTYKQALEIDPNYALAYCGLADCYLVPGYYGNQAPRQVMPLAKAAAEKALSIDSSLAEAHTSLGMVASLYEFDWKKAERHFKLALEANPNYTVGRMWYSLFFLVPVGQFDAALNEARFAQALDPVVSTIGTVVGACCFFSGLYRDAIQELERVIHADPNAVIGHYYLGCAHWQEGSREKAIEQMQQANALYKLPNIDGHLGYCFAQMGREDEARQLLAELDRDAKGKYGYSIPTGRAMIHVGLGNIGAALDLLERGLEERDHYLVFVGVDPIFQPIHSEPRFRAILEKIDLATRLA